MNTQTREQLMAVILIDCISQCNKLQVERDEYELQLKSLLRERLGSSGQKEMAI